MTPAVSVVVPVHNEERYVESSLRSVLAQTFSDLEIVVVDDGSTDATASIVQRLGGDDPRIRYHRQPNGGIVSALNAGMWLATAPLVARLDGDDEMLPTRLAEQVRFLAEHPDTGGVASDYLMIDADGAALGEVHSPLTTPEAVEDYLARGNPVVFAHSSMMFRSVVADGLGGYRQEYRDCEDVDLFTRFLDAGHPIVVLPQVLLRHRIHAASVSAGASRRQVVLNELIVHNSSRRRRGLPEVSVAEHLSRRRTWRPRIALERRLLRTRLLRRSKLATAGRSGPTRWAILLTAAALDPARAARAAGRSLRRVR